MDQMVLAAQQWVNATYANVSGYVAAPETGTTGWATMYSLTRALQHELGITALSNSFGPGTLSALSAHGDIGTGEANQNLVKIIQCGCYCKGYGPGLINGQYGSATGQAISNLMTDMGLGSRVTGKLSPKVFKALLTMDAYVLLGGGLEAIRTVQQWMNNRYYDRAPFFMMPCDGHFSRDVQKALIFSLQFELGLTDTQANGTFGPTTQANLKAQGLVQQGSSDSAKQFVHLFQAAMLFNNYDSGFDGNFSGDLAGEVELFQKFSMLPQNGRGDFQTWAQLLVSTGDPDRPGTAFDCSLDYITPERAATVKAAKYATVGRYLANVPGSTKNKKIQPGEIATIFAAGLSLFPIYQANGRVVTDFTYPQGFANALEAHDAARGYGFEPATTLYFAVDYDATQDEIESHIVPYFHGVEAGLRSRGKVYAHGVYGSRNLCAQVSSQTYARFSFVSGMSTGFSGNMGFPLPPNWSFNQIQTLTLGSGTGKIDIDKNVKSGRDPGVRSIRHDVPVLAEFNTYLTALYAAALDFAVSEGKGADRAIELTLRYLRLPEYNDKYWLTYFRLESADGPFTAVGDAALDRAGFPTRMGYFTEPMTFADLKVTHWAASIESARTWPGLDPAAEAHFGDLGGWGGDLITLFAEYWRVREQNADAYLWIQNNLGKIGIDNSFDNRNLLEDIDSFNLARLLQANGSFSATVKSYYTVAANTAEVRVAKRFRNFLSGRFGNNQQSVADAALFLLTDPLYQALRAALARDIPDIWSEAVHRNTIQRFCTGFADTLLVRTGNEKALFARAAERQRQQLERGRR
jgi:peptidoglycan hydrolase-like protein with peptidoglycan-binding domain